MNWPPPIPDAPRRLLANAAVPACLLGDDHAGLTADGEGLVRVDITLQN